ncbi:MAG TPA: glycosyltransferase family 4 protein [Planctomycetaceae bacterium]|nr:glycosyltransferase family 4 protein [Planctomycetaceae bacterium]
MNSPGSGSGSGTVRSSVTHGDEVCAAPRGSVLFLNRSYWPDVEATGQLLTSLCEGLSQDYDVSVLAGSPNAVVDQIDEQDWIAASERNGVQIHRVSHTAFPKKSLIGKGLNFLSFARSARSRLKTVEAPDVVVFETDPFLLAFAANRLRQRTNCKMIGYLQDIYPDVAVALGTIGNNWAVRRLRLSLFDIYRRCDLMVVLSQDMAQLLVEGGVSKERISIVANWADTERISPMEGANQFREQHRLGKRFVAMYSGNLGLTQRLEEFIQAAELLKDRSDIVFAFVGRGSQETALRKLVQSKALQNVLFFDYQPQSELCHSLSAASLHLVPLTTSLSRCLMPSKLYGILAAGRPFLTNAPVDSELHSIATTHHVGLTVESGSVQAIADRIQWAADHSAELEVMGQNARQLAVGQYTKDHSVARFRDVLQRVLG